MGFATEVKGPLKERCGTPAYVAPEILAELDYGLGVDMWSTGVVVFILLGGCMPFDDAQGVPKMHEDIKSGNFMFDKNF